MSLTGTMNNALSGLFVQTRLSQIVADNLANVNTEHFAKREVSLESVSQGGGGVQIASTNRIFDAKLNQELRYGLAHTAYAETKSEIATQITNVFGNPDSDASLSARLVALETAFQTAEADPSSQSNLQSVVYSAKSLVAFIGDAQGKIQTARAEADQKIGSAIDSLNASLKAVEELNQKISSQSARKQSTHSLIDQREKLIDEISSIVPVRTLDRDQQAVSLVTENGYFLLDRTAPSIEFERTLTLVPHMTATNGMLSGVEIDGDAIGISGNHSPLSGGQLQAFFNIRDDIMVSAQAHLDGVAFELANRLHDPSVEPNLGAAPGLLTDAQQRVLLENEVGLAGRLQVNTLIDAQKGGSAELLRGGLETVSAPIGTSAQLTKYLEAISSSQSIQAPSLIGDTGSLHDIASNIVSSFAVIEQKSEQGAVLSRTLLNQLQSERANMGVSTDQELQNLMTIEKAYAANARVIQVVDELMDTLLRIGS